MRLVRLPSRRESAGHTFLSCSRMFRRVKNLWPLAKERFTPGLHSARHDGPRAEKLYRQAIPIYVEAVSANDVNAGIARIKLGRTLLRQRRYAEAQIETRAGYDVLITQMDPKVSWLVNARKDLVEEYEALKQPGQVAKFQAEIVRTQAKPSEVSSKK